MSRAEELLDSLTEDQIMMYGVNPSEEPHIVIESDKTITVPNDLKHIAVQGEHNIETVTFDCPRYWDGHDLSQMSMRIVYQRPDGHREPHPVENLRVDEVDENTIHFEWTVSGNVTAVKGDISFMVCAKLSDSEGNIEREWHTRLNQDLTVDEGMDCSGDEIVEQNPDIIEAILVQLDDLKNTGGVSDEQIANAVAAYLAENPIESGVDEQEVRNIVAAYLEENPPEGGTVTDEQIVEAISAYFEENPVEVDTSGFVKTVNGNTPDENGNVEIAIPDSGQNVALTEPAYGDKPKFFIVGTVPVSKDDDGEVPVVVLYYSKTLKFKAYATLKVQGNSSTMFPKKNYTLKLYSDEARTKKFKVDFMGWGEQYKFVLKANWIDITHSRNIVGARLWRQICETRKDTLPVLLQESPRLGCVDGFPIKLYVNGTYYGRYSWNIPKDKWAFNMDDDLEEHTVLCGESNDKDVASVYAQSSDPIDGTYWSDEIHDTPPASVVTAWNRVLKFVNESTDEEFKAHIDEYIDLQSVIDYWCFHPMMGNTDAYGKNQLLITYDLVRWFIHAYDMDQFWGLDWNGNIAYAYDSGHPIIVAQYNNLILKLLRNFPGEITERFWELRGSVLSLENIINEVERWTDICSSELVAEDYATTTGNGAFTGIPSAKTNNIQQIREWLVKRFALLDTMVPYFGVNPNTDADATLYTVTYNLTNCTSSNNVERIEAGATYSATITANDGCDLDSVSVMHNGVAVEVTDGRFEIAAVDGDIVITAVASAIPTISLTGEDMTTMGVGTYVDGVFTFNTDRYDHNSYGDGFNNYQVCTREYALQRTITLSYDYEVSSDGDAVITNNIHLGNGTEPAIAKQVSVPSTTAGSAGTATMTIENIEDSNKSFTMTLNSAITHDYLGIKIMVVRGNVTIRNVRVTVA